MENVCGDHRRLAVLSLQVAYESGRVQEKKPGDPWDCEPPQKEGWIPTHTPCSFRKVLVDS